jgi:hypothetical protein
MHIRAFPVMSTRPCKLCLSLQDGSVFADFDADDQGHLYLVRISFDGYGCCYPDWGDVAVKLQIEDSRKLAAHTAEGVLDDPKLAGILRSYFAACGEAIWFDALRDHELI